MSIQLDTVEEVTAYVQEKLSLYKSKGIRDDPLWERWVEDFEGWDIKLFSKIESELRRDLRDYLISRGVYMEPNPKGKHIDQQLATEVKREEFHEWTPEQIAFYQKKNPLGVSSRCDPEDPSYKRHERTLRAAAEYEKRREDVESLKYEKKADYKEETKFFSEINSDCEFSKQTNAENNDYSPHGVLKQRPNQQNNYQLPWEERPLHKSKQLESLAKLYKDEDKYKDGTDSFDYKLKIFFNNCNNACVEKKYLKDAIGIMFAGDAREKYLDLTLHDNHLTFDERCDLIKSHYETDHWINRRETVWNTINLIEEMRKCSDKLEAFNNLERELRRIQRGLQSHAGDAALRTRIINACSGVAELHFVLFSPAKTAEGVCSDIRARFMQLSLSNTSSSQYHQLEYPERGYDSTYLAERQYQTARGQGKGQGNRIFNNKIKNNGKEFRAADSKWNKCCIVCKKTNCWSSEHTPEERRVAFDKVRNTYPTKTENAVQQFILQFEGESPVSELHHFLTINEPNDEIDPDEENLYEKDTYQYLTSEIGEINALTYLQNKTIQHKFTAPKLKFATPDREEGRIITADSLNFDTFCNNDDNISKEFNIKTSIPNEFYLFNQQFSIECCNNKYDERIFHGVLVDTGAAGHSTVGVGQAKALQAIQKELKVDKERAGEVKISGIGNGVFVSLGSITLHTPIGKVTFHILPCNTPFLLGLQDMTYLGVTPDIQKNVMMKDQKPVAALIRKYGHLWMTLGHFESLYIYENSNEPPICYLTEQQIKTCHRRWGHPSATRMWKVLRRAGHDIDINIINKISKYCQDFDAGTNFGSADFLTGNEKEGAVSTSNSINRCWNNVYIGPPDYLIHDAGKNFASAEFRTTASGWKTHVVEVPIEAHNSIGKVERAHKDLRRAYTIFKRNFSGQNVDRHSLLKMAVKALNDSAGPDGLVPTLCVFGTYPRITWDDAPAPVAKQRAETMRKVMDELQKYRATQLVNQAKDMRNGPRHHHLENVPIKGKVKVWREATKNVRGHWTGPYELYDKNGETITVLINGEKKNFRSTSVGKWFEQDEDPNNMKSIHNEKQPTVLNHDLTETQTQRARQPQMSQPPRRSQREGRFTGQYHTTDYCMALNGMKIETKFNSVYLSQDEEAIKLSLELRAKGLITTPGPPFSASNKKEIEGLIANNVFKFIPWNKSLLVKRIYKCRIVKGIKGKETPKPFEKSRLVVQAYRDEGKSFVLTQSPTIQRASQRLIFCFAISLILIYGHTLFLRDIQQAYTQSETNLIRDIYCWPSPEIIEAMNLPSNTLMHIVKPLYGIPEAGNHWFDTWINYLTKKLGLKSSCFDPCLLVTHSDPFSITGMQVDDTLFLGTEEFLKLENAQLKEAKFPAKPIERLAENNPLRFNGLLISIRDNTLYIQPNGQSNKIKMVNPKSPNCLDDYKKQRALGAWISSTCQPLVAFRLSRAAQHKNPGDSEIKELNDALFEQLNNPNAGLKYIRLKLEDLKTYCWVDGSFANNNDLTSQVGFVITLGNETPGINEFTFRGNIIHWSSTKCKRVTRAVLASELYAMTNGVDIAIPLSMTINQIMGKLSLPIVPLIICTDSRSLYECLVKLGTTKEKRLMIDVMAIRESY
ncbi:hypothetical protein K3495_g12084, partial [Podosphaera aphanis]